MRVFFAVLSLMLLAVPTWADEPAPPAAETASKPASEMDAQFPVGKWVSLFDGKSMEDWTPKLRYHKAGENWNDTFRVVDGNLSVRYDKYDTFNETFGHLFYKLPFANYRLKMEYRFVGDQCKGGPGWAIKNSGIMIDGQTPESMLVDQDFPASIEVQLLGGPDSGERPTGNLCTPSTNFVKDGKLIKQHCNNSTSKTFRGDQWVTVEVESHGFGGVKHLINGETVISYEKPQLDPDDQYGKKLAEEAGTLELHGGTISLQSESHPCDFRNIQIMRLAD